MSKSKNNASGELKSLQEEIARYKKKLEDKEWASKKTNEGIRALYKDLEKMHETLQESEERFKDIVDNTTDWIWEVDKDGKYTFASGKVDGILGYESKELIGKTPFDLMPESEAERIGEIFKKNASEKKPIVDLENWNLTKEGKRICLLTNGIPLLSESGELMGYRGVDKDITERKNAEDKLKGAFQEIKMREKKLEMVNEHLDSFAYSVSHDLRAPLRAISGFSQVLLDTYGDKVDDEMRHYLDRISEGAQKMGQLIDDLLSFSRSTRGEMKYEQTDVEKIVNDLVKAHRDIELDRDIEFVVNPLGTVEADKEMLKVVFANLLQNAIKFTIGREKACIEIGGEQKEDHIQFYVKDNGIGFDMKYKDKLFEAFQRLQTDEKFTGSGIGLATVERIVSKHGGNVWAEGEVDKGATFYFTLPSKTYVEE